MARSDTLELVCPGLLGPLPMVPHPFPRTPILDRVLSRSARELRADADPQATLLAACGVSSELDLDLPTASICVLGEAPDATLDGYWMHADPVHLRPDRDLLLVYAGKDIAPDRAEADALADAFNRHFANDGLALIAPTPSRWYLRVEHAPQARMNPLSRVQGGSMAAHLPNGPDAIAWMRLLNEAQMLFHAHPINSRRTSLGQPEINGLWTWGGGRLPRVTGALPDALVGDHPLILGLSRLAGRPHRTLDDWCRDPSDRHGDVLVFWDRQWRALVNRDLPAWSRALSELESALGKSRGGFRSGIPRRLILDPCQGVRYDVSSRQWPWRWQHQGLRSLVTVGSLG